MKRNRIGFAILAVAAVVAFSTSSASAWTYGDSWIITTPELQGSWNAEPTGGYNGAGYYWEDGFDSVRQARWRFDNSVHGGDAPTSAELFRVETWVPAANSWVYQPIEVSFDGVTNEEGIMNPNIPWGGQFGTNHQWLNRNESNQGGWVLAGPGPQAPQPGLVYAQAGSYFYVKAQYGFYADGDAYGISAIRVTVVPEPGSVVALGGGLVSMLGMALRRRR